LERRPDLGREQLGFLPGGEVAALVDLVEVGEGGVGLLDPAARGPEDLAGEPGEADREPDLRRSQPVHRDVVDDRVRGEMARGLPVDKGMGDFWSLSVSWSSIQAARATGESSRA